MITLELGEYKDKVYSGWLGKLIGVAVGIPVDGQKQVQEVTGYPQRLSESPPVSSEGTDFELAWIRTLQVSGARIGDDDLIGTWLRHIGHTSNEYGFARANFSRGVTPPVSGVHENPFRESLGALARADLWGLITPGDPEQAAWFARRDAMLDHAGAGVEAAIWLAGMVSGAFVEGDLGRLINVGLALIPEQGRVGRAVRDVVRWHGEHANWGRTREMLLRSWGSDDVRDATLAVGMIALALLQGRGEFARSLLTAANCGWSTATTCGAVGAVMGVMPTDGGVPMEWRTALPADCALGASMSGLPTAAPHFWVAEQVSEIGRMVVRSESGGRVQLAAELPQDPPSPESGDRRVRQLPQPDSANLLRQLAVGSYVTTFRRGPLRVQIDYDARPTIGYDTPRRLTVALSNTTNRTLDVQARLAAPAGFVVAAPSESITLTEGTMVSFVLTVTAPKGIARVAPANPFTLFLTVDDGSELTVPVTLTGEAVWYASGPYGSFEERHRPEEPAVLTGEAALEGEGWRRLSIPEPTVSLTSGLDGSQGTHYLASDVYAPAHLRGRMTVVCNDGIRAWLNGEEVWYQHEHRPPSPVSADEFDMELRQGWNRLVIKLAQCTPRRHLAVVLRDPLGRILLEAADTEPRPSFS